MFNYPATEIFSASGERRVVWSEEEYDEALAAGWQIDMPAPADSPVKRGKK